MKNGVPTHLLISSYNEYKIKSWSEVPKDDGVQIRYNGDITKNNGRLDEGDHTNQPWILYSKENEKVDSDTIHLLVKTAMKVLLLSFLNEAKL